MASIIATIGGWLSGAWGWLIKLVLKYVGSFVATVVAYFNDKAKSDANIEKKKDEMAEVVKKVDEQLKEGPLTQEQKDDIIKEKVRIEEDSFNGTDSSKP